MEKTLTEQATDALRRAVIRGDLAPGDRMHIHDLARRHGFGVTPIREALSRLASMGLVIALGQRGFRVAPSSLEDFQDIVRIRTHIEAEALRRSMRNGDGDWRARVASGAEALEAYVERAAAPLPEGDERLDRLHKAYHTALIAACGSGRMLTYCSSLYDEAYRYRQLFLAEPRIGAVFAAEHRELTQHVLSGDETRATAFLVLHLNRPLVVVEARLAANGGRDAH